MLAPLSSWMKVVRSASGLAAVAVLALLASVVCARVLMCLCAQQWIVFSCCKVIPALQVAGKQSVLSVPDFPPLPPQ